jgi:stage II sporulation protein P
MDPKNSDTRLFPAEKCESDGVEIRERNVSGEKKPRAYLMYCVMTLSVMLLTLTFAATELFAVFFSDVYPERFVLSRLFGSEAESGKGFIELVLEQSFCDLSFGRKPTDLPEAVIPPESSDVPKDSVIPDTSEEEGTAERPQENVPDEPANIPDGMKPIIGMDLSLSHFGLDYIHNTSAKSPDMSSLAEISLHTDPEKIYPQDTPLVLIVHTHGTEAYSDPSAPWYDPEREVARSTDKNKNVVHIGRIMADILNGNGISTVHCDLMHDTESYSGSYERSGETVERYLSKYPSIKYIIDVHRDAVVKSSGELVGAVCETEIGRCAQVMAVIGTGESVGIETGYIENLALAQRLRERLNGIANNLARPTCLRPSAYNQQYGAFSVLLEIGAAGNSLAEAELAARYSAEALCDIIKGK